MRCMNVPCVMHNIKAENSCEHVEEPSYLNCRQFHTVGIGDATVHEALKKVVDQQHFNYLTKLFNRIGRERQDLVLEKDDKSAIKDLFPSMYTIFKHLKGD